VEAFLNSHLAFIKLTRLFETIFREMEASVWKCEAFIKISIIFEDFFREIEAFSIHLSLCLCGLYKTYCRGGFLAPVRPCPKTLKMPRSFQNKL
jgi:hypothetical protein